MNSSTPDRAPSPLATRRVCQIAVVVRDLEKSASAYAEFFGLPVPPFIITAPGHEVNQTYRGQPSEARCRLAFFELENLSFELIQPLGGPSSWQDILDQHGEGIHHLAFEVTDTAGKTQTLEKMGLPLLHQGGDPRTGQFSYFDGRGKLGLLVEILEGYR